MMKSILTIILTLVLSFLPENSLAQEECIILYLHCEIPNKIGCKDGVFSKVIPWRKWIKNKVENKEYEILGFSEYGTAYSSSASIWVKICKD